MTDKAKIGQSMILPEICIPALKQDPETHLKALNKDELISLILEFVNNMQKSAIYIPVSVFQNTKLSALELIVRFLKDNTKMSNKDISRLLNRSPQNIWLTYRNAIQKLPSPIKIRECSFFFPVTIFSENKDKLSILESIVYFMRANYRLGFTELSKLMCRNPKTIWTVYKRAEKKLN